jgi:hypothetical protein
VDELEPCDLDRPVTQIRVRVVVVRQELLELDPVEPLGRAAVARAREQVLLGVGEAEQIPALTAGVRVILVEGDRQGWRSRDERPPDDVPLRGSGYGRGAARTKRLFPSASSSPGRTTISSSTRQPLT